jgi:hypothetical protein
MAFGGPPLRPLFGHRCGVPTVPGVGDGSRRGQPVASLFTPEASTACAAVLRCVGMAADVTDVGEKPGPSVADRCRTVRRCRPSCVSIGEEQSPGTGTGGSCTDGDAPDLHVHDGHLVIDGYFAVG